MTVDVRFATFEDWSNYRSYIEPSFRDVLMKNTEWTPESLSEAIERGLVSLVIILYSDELIGFGIVQDHTTPVGKWLHDAHVWVFPKDRGKGAYSKYIEFLYEFAKETGRLGVKCLVHVDEDEEWFHRLDRHGYSPRTVEYVRQIKTGTET